MSNIKENLLRMKDISSLMLDLAYSSVFLQDKEISSEVKRLGDDIIRLEKDTMRLLFKIKEPDEIRIFIINLTDFIRSIASSAMNIAQLVETEHHPSIIKDILKESERRVIAVELAKNSVFAEKPIGESRIRTFTGANIIAIKRKNKWLFDINKSSILKTKDVMVAAGNSTAEKLLEEYASGKIKKP